MGKQPGLTKKLPTFVNPVYAEHELDCVKCIQTLQPPVKQLRCGHRICESCVKFIIQNGTKLKCPGKEEDCADVDMSNAEDVLPDVCTDKELARRTKRQEILEVTVTIEVPTDGNSQPKPTCCNEPEINNQEDNYVLHQEDNKLAIDGEIGYVKSENDLLKQNLTESLKEKKQMEKEISKLKQQAENEKMKVGYIGSIKELFSCCFLYKPKKLDRRSNYRHLPESKMVY